MKKTLLFFLCSCLLITSAFALNPRVMQYLGVRGFGPSRLGPSDYFYEYPHSATYAIGCESCHYAYNPALPPDWATFVPQTIDDTLYNNLCWNCHNDITAPYVKTHSSLSTDNTYGTWTVECRVCHEPHIQTQKIAYGSDSYVYQGSVTSISDNLLRSTGAGWTDNQYSGYVVTPNVVDWLYYSYKITRNTSDNLYIEGPMDLAKAGAGNTFAITDMKLVQDTIATPSSGNRGVKFFRPTGVNSGADGDSTYDGVCEVCHTATTYFRNSSSGYSTHMLGRKCTQCHKHSDGFKFSGGKAHFTHQNLLTCADGNLGCHGVAEPPLLADNVNLANTTKCNNCHHSSNVATAKSYWDNAGTVGSWSAVAGEATYCGNCHNPTTPGNSQMNGGGDQAQDVMGNNSTYGYRVTGHGKTSGTYPRMAWQATTASGNPAANYACSGCHDLTSQHYNNSAKRLKSGFANDNNNTNCRQCHDPGTVAVAAPHMYSTYTAYQASAHNTLKCTDCHDVHGKAGAYAAMTKASKQALCLQSGCHTGMSGHALDVAFARGGSSYSLQCVSCHNVHIVTGRISASDNTKTPLSRIDNNLVLWGGAAGQKMNDFAGSGTYRTPTGDTLTGAQLPDYPSFCLQCHSGDMSPSSHGSISWGGGEPHGLNSANMPNGNPCPNWYGCGMAYGWDGDDCTGGDNVCFPVIPRGAGEHIWSRAPYTQTERMAGANFVLSCSDCHVTHESGIGSKLRSTVNNSPGSTIWNTECNACHWYYADWHAGFSCPGCHADLSIHRMGSKTGTGATRTFDNTLVTWQKFENNLNDSGDWRMHGRWMKDYDASWTTGTRSYQPGRIGTAIEVSNQSVEIGTQNGYWSTDAGYHNTWTASEMKYNMTLEAWVYPTDANGNERRILAKHTYWTGGYALTLKKINGAWRAGLLESATGASGGLRGAYSTISVPLNQWTHVAAAYDWSGPNRNPNDGSVGRIRIYVNGEDVTTSDTSGDYIQPGPGENAMYPYSKHNVDNPSVCYNGSWCASALFIGGASFSDNAYNFIGRIDEVKIWNITKSPSYFDTIDAMTIPRIDRAEGVVGNDNLFVTFSEGVYTTTGGVGALVPADFVLTDTDNGRTITGVTHTAGASTAVVRLSSVLDASNDINVDTLRAAANAIYDDHSNAADNTAVVISASSACPTGQVVFNLNEAAGAAYVLDNSGLLYGVVNDPSNTMGSGTFYGDNINNYISFQNNTSCMKATTNLTLEARIKPTSMSGTGNYTGRVFAKDTSYNYQMTVWRTNLGTCATTFNAPSGVGSIAFWVAIDNTLGGNTGNAWKPVLTNYTTCPIVSDHWYQVKVVWDSAKSGGTPGQPFVPADIFVEDQGTDGLGAGRTWAGYNNCTKSDQSYNGANCKIYTGDKILAADSIFAIGCAAGTLGNNKFQGNIDWIKWWGAAGAPPSGPVREQPDYELDLFQVAPTFNP